MPHGPSGCDRCTALERWLQDLRLEIEDEIARREHGFGSATDEKVSRQLLDEALEILAKTEALYEHHCLDHSVGRARYSCSKQIRRLGGRSFIWNRLPITNARSPA